MDTEQAILTAIHYETRVRDVYREAAARAAGEAARRALGFLAREEQYHLDFLAEQLAQWRRQGVVSPDRLRAAGPGPEAIAAAAKRLESHLHGPAPAQEMETLRRALAVEKETSDFYRRLAGELAGEPQRLFARFLEVEEGHLNLVQAELDSLSGLGFWFDCPEFDLEKE